MKISERISLVAALLFILLCQTGFAQEVIKESFMFAPGLFADRYYANRASSGSSPVVCNSDAPACSCNCNADGARLEKSPAVIFMFGGSFYTGTRDRADYIPYFHYLAENGYQVFSIDYRLGLKPMLEAIERGDFSGGEKMGKIEMLKGAVTMLQKSIDMAVEDLYKATAFVIGNAGRWGIDTSLIVTSGSSAGAITALQGEYYICNWSGVTEGNDAGVRVRPYDYMPQGFRYAGVVAFAGAILNSDGKMKWNSTPAPMMLFHGNADCNVPYGKLWTPFASFNGSEYIAEKLTEMEAPHYFYSIENATHSVAISPMKDNLPQIIGFLEEFVIGKKDYITNTYVREAGVEPLKRRIKIKDYIKANFE